MAYNCVIFDFDGTLADTEGWVRDIYNEIAEKHGYDKIDEEQFAIIKTMTFHEIIKSLNISYKKAMTLIKEGQKILKKKMDHVIPFEDDVANTLLEIEKKVKVVGIISSNTKRNIKKFLKNVGIDSISFVVSSPLFSKEHKILSVIKKYHLKKDEVLYVGDEVRDVISSNNAGVACAAASWGYNTVALIQSENPTYIINSIKDLLKIIDCKEV